jgi:AcrR family transcriptional regulator
VSDTRERIARCALEQFLERPYDEVTLATVAEASAVSHQTVLNHFGSKEGVFAAAVDVLEARISATRAAAVPGDAAGAVESLFTDYERSGDANVRFAVLESRLPHVAERLVQARAHHQAWLAQVFAGALPTRGAKRQRALAALHAATDVYTWKLLRRDLGLERAEAARVMEGLVVSVLRQFG